MNPSAVSDAQRNAEINGVKNCRFICSKVSFFFMSLAVIVIVLLWQLVLVVRLIFVQYGSGHLIH